MDDDKKNSFWKWLAYLVGMASILVYIYYLYSFIAQWGHLYQQWNIDEGEHWYRQFKLGYYAVFAAGLIPALIAVRLLLFGKSAKEWIVGLVLVIPVFPIHYVLAYATANTDLYALFHIAELLMLVAVFFVAHRIAKPA